MNPKKSNTGNSSKTMPKKKGKLGNSKPSSQTNETSIKITKDDSESVQQEKSKKTKPSLEEPKKLERSNSFIFTRTLSKIYTKLSGSKENLDKAKDNDKSQKLEMTPFRFQRSLTLNSIQLKNNYRKNFPESRLEKLSEEKICDNDKLKSPPKSPPVSIRGKESPTSFRRSMPPGSFDNIDHSFLKPPSKLERSDSFISLIKRKVSFSDQSKSAPLNSNWAVSLQNLQQIDNMVSYEDLSFVNYDKFNQYEQKIDKMLQQQNKKLTSCPLETKNHTMVKMRPKRNTGFMTEDHDSNLDQEKNLYRQSIDSNKLRFLSTINSDYRLSKEYTTNPVDWLSLDNTRQSLNLVR